MHEYTPNEIRLAKEFADTLNDHDSISFHLKNARRFKEEFLRRKLAKVMETPDYRITNSRAALYTHLIKQSIKYGDAGH